MKIHEYNEMMAYLTRPAPKKVAGLMEEYYGSDQLKYQEAVKNGFQGTFEEYLQWMRENAAQGGVIGKGGMFQGEDLGYRTGFKKLMVSDMYERGPKKGKVLLQQTPKDWQLKYEGQPWSRYKGKVIPKGAVRVNDYIIVFTGKNAVKNQNAFYEKFVDHDEFIKLRNKHSDLSNREFFNKIIKDKKLNAVGQPFAYKNVEKLTYTLTDVVDKLPMDHKPRLDAIKKYFDSYKKQNGKYPSAAETKKYFSELKEKKFTVDERHIKETDKAFDIKLPGGS